MTLTMNSPTSVMEMISKAAVKVGAHVHEAYRHSDLKHVTDRKSEHEVIQGFTTTHGRFVDREEAAKIALASGQIKFLSYSPNLLFTADLY